MWSFTTTQSTLWMEGAEREEFKFNQTLSGSVICFNTIPWEYIKKVMHIRDKADTPRFAAQWRTYRQKERWWRLPWSKTRSTSCANVIRKRYVRGNSLRDWTTSSTHTWWHLTSKRETLAYQRKENFKEDEHTSWRVQSCQHCKMENVVGTTVCGPNQLNLSQEQEEQAQTLLQEGFAYNQALTQHEIRPRNLTGNIHGQSRAQRPRM